MEKMSKRQIVILVVAVLALGTVSDCLSGRVSPIPGRIHSRRSPLTLDNRCDIPSPGFAQRVCHRRRPPSGRLRTAGRLHSSGRSSGCRRCCERRRPRCGQPAARLEDGEQVTVPVKSADGSSSIVPPTSPASNPHARVSINHGRWPTSTRFPALDRQKHRRSLITGHNMDCSSGLKTFRTSRASASRPTKT